MDAPDACVASPVSLDAGASGPDAARESEDASSADAAPSSGPCGRYRERVATGCRAVEVSGVDEVPLDFERAGYTLRGTLAQPRTEGRYLAPGVVLVHGSGPNDRDETVDGELGVSFGEDVPIFAQLSMALARAGLAVYRYGKRSCFVENSDGRCSAYLADYPGDLDDVLISDFVLDARAALAALRDQPGVDPHDLLVIGHSEGANFVPKILADQPGVAAGVQLAGASLPVDQVIVAQVRELADELEHEDAARYQRQIAALRQQADRDESNLRAIRDGSYAARYYDGVPVAHWRNWMEETDHLQQEFTALVRPILLVQGTADRNVRQSHLVRFHAWALEAGMTSAEFVLLPNTTHTFVTLTGDNRFFEPFVSARAVDAIVRWHRGLPAIRPGE